MKLHRRALLSCLVVPTMAAVPLAVAGAQASSTETGVGTLLIDGYYTNYRLETLDDDRLGMGGMGARLMWRLGDENVPAILNRTAVGLYAEYAPAEDKGFALLHAGLQGDFNLVRAPLFGRLEPAVSLGAGVLQTSVENSTESTLSRFEPGLRKSASFTLSPAIGARISLWRQLGLRADARDFIIFHGGALHNPQFTVGLSFLF